MKCIIVLILILLFSFKPKTEFAKHLDEISYSKNSPYLNGNIKFSTLHYSPPKLELENKAVKRVRGDDN